MVIGELVIGVGSSTFSFKGLVCNVAMDDNSVGLANKSACSGFIQSKLWFIIKMKQNDKCLVTGHPLSVLLGLKNYVINMVWLDSIRIL